jgi:hypothetical protein
MVHSKRDGISLPERYDLRARLHARALFGKYKFAAREVFPGFREQDGNLDWKDMFAVQVLVQAVIVAFLILEQERRRFELAGMVATLKKRSMLLGVMDIDAHCIVPSVGRLSESRVECHSKLGNNPGQGIAEIFVFAPPEAMTRHYNTAPKKILIGVELGQIPAFVRKQDVFENRISPIVEFLQDAFPIERLDAADDTGFRNPIP